MKNVLVVISAPSGAGKTTLCQKLLGELEKELVLSISSTTRPPRGQERDGVEYYFLSVDQFKHGIAQGEFAEWALVHGNYYGTAKKTIESAFARGKSVLLDIDVQGADLLKKAFPDRTVRIFIAPPDMQVLEQRLRSRGTDPEETIQKRMKNAREEMLKSHEFDHVVVNDDFDRAYAELRSKVLGAIQGATHG
jgi:guanylate kinase